MKKIFQERLLLFVLGLTLILFFLQPVGLTTLAARVQWPTLLALSALILTTTGIKKSGLMQHWAQLLVGRLKTERTLWFLLVFFSAAGAMFLTNDIMLFLIIPLTLQINDKIYLKVKPLLIVETIAVNIGSMLTPIGNPQNIFLWQKSGIGFGKFVALMFPVFAIQCILLLGVVFCIANSRPLNRTGALQSPQINYALASVSAILFLGFLLAHQIGIDLYFAGGIIILYLLFYREVFLKTDWTLIGLFLLLFIDVGALAQLPILERLNDSIHMENPASVFGTGIVYSQIISNVPATLLLSHYTLGWKYLAWGVNLGGNGLIIASFANLITLRLARKHKIGWRYHFYAVPFLIISTAVVYLWIILI